jgi:glutathione S-transferase
MLTVLGRAASINVRKVLWTCSELGLEPGREEWGAGELSLQSPRFLALNPNALVPVLLDGDLVLFESNTICRYLAARQGRHDLLPAEAAARARVEQWMDWQATELNNAWRYAFMARVRRSPDHADAAAIEPSVQAWNRHMAVLEGRAAPHERLCLRRLLHAGRCGAGPGHAPLDGHANGTAGTAAVARFYGALCQRPAFPQHGRNGLP